MFKALEDMALGITQGYFGEAATFTHDNVETEIKAVFSKQWIESGDVSTYQMTCRIVLSDLAQEPGPSDTITRGSIIYGIDVVQPDGFGGAVLVLKD